MYPKNQNFIKFIKRKLLRVYFSLKTNEKSRDFCTFLSKHQEYISKNYTKENDLQSYLLNEPDFKKHKYSLLIFRLNLGKKVLDVLPINNMGNLKIDTDLTDLNSKSIFKNVSHEKGENNKIQINKIKIFSSDNRTYSFQVNNFLIFLKVINFIFSKNVFNHFKVSSKY
jgi:hypothetical protein